jgi:hypothetical protein
MRELVARALPKVEPTADFVTLVEKGAYIDEVVASILFPYATVSLPQLIAQVRALTQEEKDAIITEYVGKREHRRDRTGRGLEAGYPLMFDLVGGFAEYRDLERHRMLTQQRQLLSCDLGFIMPSEVIEVGMEALVLEVVNGMEALNAKLKAAGLTTASQYATLFNHRIRFMFGMNMREFQHMSELRTQPAGHFSYRRMLMEMSRQVKKRHPWSEKVLGFVDYSDPGNKIARAKEQSKIAGKNLASGIDSGQDFVE